MTMMFSILPNYLAVTKLAFTLIFILFVIPLLAGTVFRSEVEDSLRNGLSAASSLTFPGPDESWWRAGIWVARDYARSLWFIVRTTVPLMFLAAVMGSLMVTLVPLTSVAKMGTGFIPAILLAVLGLFLPVPMAFDVIVSASLLAAGLPVFYVMILLFVLGIYSCYSAFIVGTTVSWRVSLVLFAVLSAMGLLAGAVGGCFPPGAARPNGRVCRSGDERFVEPHWQSRFSAGARIHLRGEIPTHISRRGQYLRGEKR